MDEQPRPVDIPSGTIRTESLAEGALFVSPDGVLYKVVMAERAGFRKAEPWPGSALNHSGDARQPVALVPGSLLARNYPVVTEGRPLPVLSRADFLRDGHPTHFVFPEESLARLAAWLDVALAPRSGLAVSKERQRWLLSDGHHDFRVYHYLVDRLGLEIDLGARFAKEGIEAQPCERGPRYWRYLPGWTASVGELPEEEPQPVPENGAGEPAATTLAPSVSVVAEKVETQASSLSMASAQDVAMSSEHRFSLRALFDYLYRARRKKDSGATTPVVEPAAKEPETPPALETKPEVAPWVMEAPETPPTIEAAPEVVTPSVSETPETLPIVEQPLEAVASSLVEPSEPPPVVETPSETVIPSPAENETQPFTPAQAEATVSFADAKVESKPASRPRPPKRKPRPAAKSSAKKPKTQRTAESAKPVRVAMPDTSTPAESFTLKSGRSQMILSIDIGYGYTKGAGPDGLHFSFPSVVGTAEEIPFSIGLIQGQEDRVVRYGDWTFSYGEHALLQSRIQSTIFDRSRVRDHVYKMLFVAALVEMSRQVSDCKHIKVITGLPVDFFNDRAEVVKAFEGAYQITTNRVIKCAVESVYVAPQPFGSLFRELLNDRGKIVSTDIEKRRIGVIDVGTYTTDFIVSDALRYVQRLSGTLRIGWSKVINKVQQVLSDRYHLELGPHEVDRDLQAGAARVHGELVPLQPLVEPAVAEIQTAIIARARDLWGEAADLDAILVTGGAGSPVYDAVRDVYPHARLLDNAFWANVEGLQRFARRPTTFHD
jgi:plasmid segregation protein ParM